MLQSPVVFSSGFQIRIQLAGLLVSEPHMLLLDEPTNYLDLPSIRWLLQFLRVWPGEVMMISHDRGFLDKACTHVLSIHRQKLRKMAGDTSKLYQQIQLEEEVYEKTRINDEKKRKQEEDFIRRFRAKARLAGMVQSRVKSLEKRNVLQKLETINTLNFHFNYKEFQSKNLLEVQGVGFHYPGCSDMLLNDLSFSLHKGDRVGVIGRNGKGKSTLLRLLAGQLSSCTGHIKTHLDLISGYYGDSCIKELLPGRTVEEEVMSSTGFNGDRSRVRGICGAMMFEGDNALKHIQVLSGGEKSRVCLGKLLLQGTHLLLLDEPTNHLDTDSCEALIQAINKYPGGVIFVTHSEMLLEKLATRLIIFDRGSVNVMNIPYGEFLREVGWSGEEESRSKPSSAGGPSKKELRKLKAQCQEKRNKELRPLKQAMEKLEQSIERLEQNIHNKNQELISASLKNDSVVITALSIEINTCERESENLYKDLEETTSAYENAQQKWEQELVLYDS
jgi:ATP-binding cassette subfamily F protein 3